MYGAWGKVGKKVEGDGSVDASTEDTASASTLSELLERWDAFDFCSSLPSSCIACDARDALPRALLGES